MQQAAEVGGEEGFRAEGLHGPEVVQADGLGQIRAFEGEETAEAAAGVGRGDFQDVQVGGETQEIFQFRQDSQLSGGTGLVQEEPAGEG